VTHRRLTESEAVTGSGEVPFGEDGFEGDKQVEVYLSQVHFGLLTF
jgi:hypothetical protein